MTTATRVETIAPLTRAEAEHLARTEYARVADQLRSLAPDDWPKPTDCAEWDVRAMAGHVLGMMTDVTSLRRLFARMRRATRAAKESGGAFIDSMTAGQVDDNAHLSTADLVAQVDDAGPRAARWRAHAPALLRRMPMKEEVGGVPETWRMAYLLDVVLTRDPWMHRVDIARATGRQFELSAEHDGRLVADVVAEWARRHGRAFVLTLTGPAGGEYAAGTGGDEITIDAVEFCRVLSGRSRGQGLLTQEVPF
jgi:uncharacterized protein (TIGR03083 family)